MKKSLQKHLHNLQKPKKNVIINLYVYLLKIRRWTHEQ